jgi:phosphatidylserine decarboxylase
MQIQEGMLARGSVPLISIPLILAIVFMLLWLLPISIIFLIITIFFIIFFRDPVREIGEGIVAPADGKLTVIEEKHDILRLSIVMGLGNVHVNRAPLDGKVIKIEHILGKHVIAASKDSDANERVITTVDTKIGQVKIVQIAGAFARRIKQYINEGDKLEKGQRIGIIRFGSRVDLYLPKEGIMLEIKQGATVKAGSSSIGTEVADENR